MAAVGMIHMACFCGADLLYLGDTADGSAPFDIIDQLLAKLAPGSYGFFTSANGQFGECPHCGALFELPPVALVNRLPTMSRAQVQDLLENQNGRTAHHGLDASSNGHYRRNDLI